METALLQFVNDDLLAGSGIVVTADDEIVLDGTVDSLGVTRLIGYIDERFGIAIPAEDVTIEHFRSIGAIADYLRRRREAESAA